MKTQVDQLELDREALSALMDGQLRPAEAGAALQSLASDEARECWRLYHLVGDVLRSPDLAGRARDPDFLGRLSARLQQEAAPPPSLPAAPATAMPDLARPAANDGVFRWKLVAGLASFAAVATIGWSVMGGVGPQPSAGPQLAQARPGSLPTQVVTLQSAPVPTPAVEAAAPDAGDMGAVMLRDPRLDELLAAHRQTSGASALGSAAGFLRNATFEGPGR